MKNYLVEQYVNMISKIDSSPIRVRNEDNKRLTLQFFSKGEKYDGNLMVVGRAVNGWDDECSWQHGTYRELSPIEMIIKAFRKSKDDPLKWVVGMWGNNEKDKNGDKLYNTATSPFWQLTKQTLKFLSLQDDWDENIWSTRLIWSNLYKVAPANGGNPNDIMQITT